MENFRPFALSLAGFDPSGGAGVLSDIKTFEAHDVQGFGVTTAITYQTAEDFIGMNWMSADVVTAQLLPLIEKYPLSAMKIGIVEDFHLMSNWIGLVKGFFPTCKIVLDPVLRASAGYDFHDENTIKWLDKVLNSIDLITPNWKEMEILANGGDVLEKAKELSQKTHVLLKGGHHPTHKGDDILLYKGQEIVIEGKDINAYEKHGSGCVLSSAIAGHLAHGKSIEEACRRGKDYIENFLESDPSRLGQHTVLVQHD